MTEKYNELQSEIDGLQKELGGHLLDRQVMAAGYQNEEKNRGEKMDKLIEKILLLKQEQHNILNPSIPAPVPPPAPEEVK